MNDIGDGLGTAIEGGALARVIERERAGASDDVQAERGACLNCGTALIGPHCHGCGQAAHIHRTVGAVMHDLLHGVLHADGKLWRTLPMLALRPGKLTRDYIDGKRARFLSPISIFLFSVFTMFAVFSILGLSMSTEMTGAEVSAVSATEQLEEERAALVAQLEDDSLSEQRRASLRADIEGIDQGLEAVASVPGLNGDTTGLGQWKSGWDRLDKGIAKWQENPGLMLYKLQTNAYKFSWLLIPLSLPFMWILFAWRRRFGMYDHAIFVTYSIAFMSLVLIALTVATAIGLSTDALLLIFSVIAPVHIWLHLKGTYELGWFSATWRTIALLFIINVFVIGLFGAALVVLGLVG